MNIYITVLTKFCDPDDNKNYYKTTEYFQNVKCIVLDLKQKIKQSCYVYSFPFIFIV